MIRENPKSFVPYLDKCINRMQGLKLYNEAKSSYVQTVEGAGAYHDAIKFLKKQRPVKPMEWSDQL